ncbi:MAG: NAD-glutamate dehydrogenase [Proteobacteria bacterium]|nr:NAD-glutamate dehydrogenase [Pseudomonadota bacterium]
MEQLAERGLIERIATAVPKAAAFTRQLYAGVSAGDLGALSLDELVAGAKSIWEFAAERPRQKPIVRIFHPTEKSHGWSSQYIVAEIVNDDMPFLVDSVTAALQQHGLTVEMLAHPVVKLERDGRGKRTGFDRGASESVMQLRLSGPLDAAGAATLTNELRRVLADVRAAVGDWRAMLKRLTDCADELGRGGQAPAGVDIDEERAFLYWLANNHFTLLGAREYVYDRRGRQAHMTVVDGSGLGILRDPAVQVFAGARNLVALPVPVRAYLELAEPLMIAKATQRATVHRSEPMDVIGVKRLDTKGRVVAEQRFVGLFTSSAYGHNPHETPLVRRKIADVVARAGLDPQGHDGKALLHVLETFPRDELFQVATDELHAIALGILQLQERRRIALFVRRDPFERFVSCLVYVPQDRYSSSLRDQFGTMLAEAFAGEVASLSLQVGISPLARLRLLVTTTPGNVPVVDLAALEARLVEIGRTWTERLTAAAVARHGDAGYALVRRYAKAFPAAYIESVPAADAIDDIARIETSSADLPALQLYRRAGRDVAQPGFKIFRKGRPVHLSDILPMLENRGFRVLTETPYETHPAGDDLATWIHDLELQTLDRSAVDVDAVRALFHDSFLATWRGLAEDDGFNRLTLTAQLAWREVALLRAYAKYLRQTGFTFSQSYIEATLAQHPGIASSIVRLFRARFDPTVQKKSAALAAAAMAEIERALDTVTILDEDRILRRYVNLVTATLRTNYYQPGPDDAPKPYMSFKLDSRAIDGLPKPRPLVEIWMYAPETEGIHLRGGKVARGGIRWSDRREDFRTEILGLMKAQQVKNAVIVPVGSKGGFVIKRPLSPSASRAAVQAQGIECYRTLMRGMLDITDNRKGATIVHPAAVVRHDGDDPYLVVAADKGTATFSDIANAVAHDYGFWLDDAFASGGSVGYDHKALGITARGAWVAVQRHFRELGVDLERQAFTVVGIGDMAGDVFGNGMLRSRQTRLVAAFNHQHIFLDPDPDPAASFEERQRLFTTPRTTWADYNGTLISKGGGVFERSAKSIKLTAEIKALLGLAVDATTPAELIQAMLKAPVDLLWFGGIGTYVKSADEGHLQAGDRTNDALRVDARDVRARVIGEGANLGVTQRGRIEYAAEGGRINTDAIDNSAGVDMSDHEVNIKILLSDPVAAGKLTVTNRNKLLASMADEVSDHVLRDNYLQTLAMSLAARAGPELIDPAQQLMRRLEHDAGLDRALEALPSDAALTTRRSAKAGLHRPEIAVLLAYAKLDLHEALLKSPLLDDPALEHDLRGYFPKMLQQKYPDAIRGHGLRREIIGTVLANEILNRGGLTFVSDLETYTGQPAEHVAKVFAVSRALFGLDTLWVALEALDDQVDAARQLGLFARVADALRAAARWLLRQTDHGAIGDTVRHYAAGVERLTHRLPKIDATLDAAPPVDGVPPELERRVALLASLARHLDILRLAEVAGVDVADAAKTYVKAGRRFGIASLRALAAGVPTPDGWSRTAVANLADDLADHQERIARRILRAPRGLEEWIEHNRDAVARLDQVVANLQTGGAPDLARLAVAERVLREMLD